MAGLYKRAILESGTGVMPWALEGNVGYPSAGNSSRDFAVSLGCHPMLFSISISNVRHQCEGA